MSNRPQIQSAVLSHLQALFKQSLEATISKYNTRTTFLCASRHLLLYCDNIQCDEITRIPALVADWAAGLTHKLRTYKFHIRNHFLPFVEALIRHQLQPQSAQPPKRIYTKSCCPNCQKEMLKKNLNRHLNICRPVM